MAKGFSEQERDVIGQKILEAGEDIFGRYGLKKTSIEDITKAVGIAKGSFYSFYVSKEECLMDILENLEIRIRGNFIKRNNPETTDPEKFIKNLLKELFKAMKKFPVAKIMFNQNEIRQLMIKLPPERIAKHQKNDDKFFMEIIKKWQRSGRIIQKKPEVIAGVLKSVILLTMQSDVIGEKKFSDIYSLITDLVATGLTKQNTI